MMMRSSACMAVLMGSMAVACGDDDPQRTTGADPAPTSRPTSLEAPFGSSDDTLGHALQALVDRDRRVPADAAEATALASEARFAEVQVATDPSAAAARILPVCQAADLRDSVLRYTCFELLALIETPATLTYLEDQAEQAIPTPSFEASEGGLQPQVESAARAYRALGRRAAHGSREARAVLERIVPASDERVVGAAIEAVYLAMPRVAAKRFLLEHLPERMQPLIHGAH